ncbi:MAG TPA: alanine--tRNA ligase, partial [bacterium]|nr:alanine--tRNA ligase [bacterium]
MAHWTTDKARETFLNYFKERGHTVVASSPLLPAEDKTLLFTNAGMNQFKNLFLGQEKRSYSRATTAQKCVRAGGKHNDLENVGFTARHHTFFEMLGNFSFGDYFKKEAIAFAWELVTDKKYFGLDKSRLYVTIYKDDDEAFEIWNKQEKVPAERIFRLGEKDNFWSMGDTGPCGPCSEIHYDMWDNFTSREHFKGNEPDWDHGRFVEIWNLVFMQFDRDAAGTLTPLPKPSIDTGMGLERITAALNGVPSNYDIDVFVKLIGKLKELHGGTADPAQEASWRVIADHARAIAFLIADSITPSNEGRGYVLRRIMRRAIRHGHKLGFTELFFHRACDLVIELMGHHYKELKGQREMILAIATEEEKRFRQTLDKGLLLLNDGITSAKKAKTKTLPGDLVFKLYDTYGFPPDLTQTILAEQGLSYDVAGYDAAMKEQQERGKASWSGGSEEKKLAAAKSLHDDGIGETKFEGYDKSEMEGELLALFNGELDRVDSVRAGSNAYAILSPLLFYAESGGQVGDKGTLEKNGTVAATVTDCVKLGEYRAAVVTAQTDLMVGTRFTQKLEEERRSAIRRNHSATHLLHLALRKTLGDHAHQSGSLVTQERLRFDFSHFKAVTPDELRAIETEVNRLIQKNYKTCT